MKVVEINSGKHGSTGNIMLQIAELAREKGIDTYTFSGPKTNASNPDNHAIIGSNFSYLTHRLLANITGLPECFSIIPTLKLIKKLKKIKPDIIHLHNMHGWYINLPILFKYIKKNHIRTVWTLHDCWALTGNCAHFDLIGCDRWKTECKNCSQIKEYPQTLFDNSKWMHKLKKKWFTGVKDLTIVTPSKWSANLVTQSFLKEYPVKVINNGINLSVFKPTPSDFRKKHNIEDKFVLLGVSAVWTYKKGLDVFIELSKLLDNRFQIVLVGTTDAVDKQLPNNIISIHKTQNQVELAEIYTASDLFVNPTREEVLGLVNIEALACGTPVLTFDTGGAPECINEECGFTVKRDDISSLHQSIIDYSSCEKIAFEKCYNKACEFDKNKKFKEYIDLYLNSNE